MSRDGQENLVGIDLGTTFSVIAHLNASGRASALPNADGAPLTPSVIYLDGKTAVVGQPARDAAAGGSTDVALFVKRDMGKSFYSKPIGGKQYRPETLSAIILRKLKQDAERHIGPIRRAVITVPAFFDDTRRKATQDAGRIAGLDVLEIINEPTAAALSYAAESSDRGQGEHLLDLPGGELTALVYDLGGGTFDVTVVRLASKRFETLATDGAVKLGGKDWDDVIVKHVAQEFIKQHGIDPLQDEERRMVLAAQAEKTKRTLTNLPKANIECFHQGHDLRLSLTREKFEEISRDLLAQTRIVTDLVVQQAKLDWSRIDRVLLVGGSTKMPMVAEMLAKVTGKTPDKSLDPDQVVARGAAIHAGIVTVQGNTCELAIDAGVREDLAAMSIVNVNAYSLGIGAWKRIASGEKRLVSDKLIHKNTQLPSAASEIYYLPKPNVRRIVIPVLEGEADAADDNIRIGECIVSDLQELPVHSPIQVRLNYDENGRIHVLALDMTSGKTAHTEIKREHGLTEADIRREKAFVDSLEIQ